MAIPATAFEALRCCDGEPLLQLHGPTQLFSASWKWCFGFHFFFINRLGANLDAWMTVRTGAAHVEEVWRATWSWEHNPSQEFHTILGEGATL